MKHMAFQLDPYVVYMYVKINMNDCMCVSMYTYIYTCKHANEKIHVCIYTCMYVCMYVRMYVYIIANEYIYV